MNAWRAVQMPTQMREASKLTREFREEHGRAGASSIMLGYWINISQIKNKKYKAFKFQNYMQWDRGLSWDNKPLNGARPTRPKTHRYY